MNELTRTAAAADCERLFELVPSDKAGALMELAAALKLFEEAPDKAAAAKEIAVRFAGRVEGLSLKSLYRKAARLRAADGSILSLVDARALGRKKEANPEFTAHWHALVLANRRKMRPAWSALIRQFRKGDPIPGVGTWRDLYLKTWGVQPAEGEPCPWDERTPPPGWSYCSLARLAPKKATRLAASIGPAAALLQYGFTVRKTRVGLQCCQVIEVDDMWYEHKVLFKGNRLPQRVVEFAAQDRLTGHVVCNLMKVNRERPDGSLETMKSVWARYVYHYCLCVSGIPAAGCIFDGEHGTMSEDETFSDALAKINAYRQAVGLGPVAFRAGAIQPRALAKGLPQGPAKGNPRHKGMIEGYHALLKNEVGDIIGEVGGGRDLEPEAAVGMVAESRRLTDLCNVLEAARPGISLRLRHPFLRFDDFAVAAAEAHRRLDMRTRHDLEGWEDCGFTVNEIRFGGSPHWQSVRPEAAMTPQQAAGFRALVASGAVEVRTRRMSPAEAWAASRSQLSPLPPFFAPMILGDELSASARVSDALHLAVRSPDTGEVSAVAAFANNRPLERGRTYRVWINPLDPQKAYVADLQGNFLGTAPVLQAARADADADIPELQRQLGLRSKALADERRRLAPHIRSQLRRRNQDATANLAALGLADPTAAATFPLPSTDASLARLAAVGTEDVDHF